ncbi:MAG: MCE family protein [Planctomyces sp.]|nr:MCE family protein [Planctomyces sp.]
MSERQLQFRVGMMVLVALAIGTGLLVRAGKLDRYWSENFSVAIQFDSAGGIYPSAPVLMYGLTVGNVRDVRLDPKRRGVIVIVELDAKHKLPADSTAQVAVSLLGEGHLEVVPGTSAEFVKNGDVLKGQAAGDPLALVARLEAKTSATMDSFAATSKEWGTLAHNVNSLLETKRGNIDQVIERAADSLDQLSLAMKSATELIQQANRIVGDPKTQAALQQTAQSLPRLVNDTRETIVVARTTLESMQRNLQNLESVTDPLAKKGTDMIARVDTSLANLDRLLADASRFVRVLNTQDGTLQKLASDPQLYDNLNRSSQLMNVLLRGIEPIVQDMREFSDKVARRPEILGVGGAIQPSNGLRDTELIEQSGGNGTKPAQKSTRPSFLPGR